MPQNRKAQSIAPLWISQNFLTGAAAIERLLQFTNVCKTDHVVEIGAGRGHITLALAARCGHVTSLELDAALYGRLQARLAGYASVQLLRQDFLTWQLPAKGDYKVVSNIPFSLTTAILTRLTQCPNPPRDIYLVVEKGAAMRFAGLPRESVRSIALKPYFDTELACAIRREDFHPMPRVEAALLHLSRKDTPDLPAAQRDGFERFVRAHFEGGAARMRASIGPGRLSYAGVDAYATPGDIRYVQWLCLYRCVHPDATPPHVVK